MLNLIIMNWPKRVFVAINLPEDVKSQLGIYQKKWSELPCNWVPVENLHITLAFLGNTGKRELESMEQIVGEIAQKQKPFDIFFKKICYGPPKIIPPSLIWVEGEESKELTDLKRGVDNLLAKITDYSAPKRKYVPHITLGRIKKFEWRRYNTEGRAEINEELSISFRVNSIEIMESQLKKTGAEYYILKSFNL